MKFQSAPKVELDHFFGNPVGWVVGDKVFQNQYLMTADRIARELAVLDINAPRSDQARVKLLEVLRPVCRSFFYSMPREEEPMSKLRSFMSALVDTSLALIAEDKQKGFSKKSLRLLKKTRGVFTKFRAAHRGGFIQWGRIKQQLAALLSATKNDRDFPKRFRNRVEALYALAADDVRQFLNIAGRMLGEHKYLNWDTQADSGRLYGGYSTIEEMLGSEKAQSLVYALLDKLKTSGFCPAENARGWLNRAKQRKYWKPEHENAYELEDEH